MGQVNRHIVDQLADVRAQIKALDETEAGLKEAVSKAMGGRDSLGGDQFIARQTISERKGALDDKKMAADGIKVEKYRKPPVTVYSIRVDARAEEDA